MTKKEQKKRRLRASRARLLKDIREARAILRNLGVSGTANRTKRAEADSETRRAWEKNKKKESFYEKAKKFLRKCRDDRHK